MDYKQLATQILQGVGGPENVQRVWHCATRLRFELTDPDKAKTSEIENQTGVLQVVQARGQFQVVIGTTVDHVFDQLKTLPGITDKLTEDEKSDAEPQKQKGVKGLLNAFIGFISGLFMPFLGAIVGAGVLKGFLALAVALHWIDSSSGTYLILNAAGDAMFTFLPMFIAFTGAKQLHVDQFVSVSIAAALVYPSIVALATKHATIHFLGIPVVAMSYTGSVIPIILALWALSYLEPLLGKIIPEALRYVFLPLLELVIMVPLTLIVVGPIGSTISNLLASGLMAVYNAAPIVAGLVIGAFWQVIVIFGFHWMILPLMMNNVTTLGADPLLPIACAAVVSQCGAALGVFLKTKNTKMKEVSGSAFIAALFGITEPTLYGVTLKLKKPFYYAIASSAVGGAVIGFFRVGANAFTFPSFLAVPTYLGHGFIGEIIGLGIAFVGGAVLSYLFGVNDKELEETAPNEAVTATDTSLSSVSKNASEDIVAPIAGTRIPLSNVNDPAFSSGQLGQGIAILPRTNVVTAPADGVISVAYPTGHAIGLTTDSGAEILIHIGIDTVSLKGKYFDSKVAQGQRVHLGDELVRFDRNAISKAGYDTTVIIVVTNSDSYLVEPNEKSESEVLLKLTAKK